MTLFTAEAGTNGTLLTPANTGFIGINGTTATFTTERSHSGSTAYRFAIVGGTTTGSAGTIPFPVATKEPAADWWAYFTSYPTTNAIRYATFRNSAGTAMFFRITVTGTFHVQNALGTGTVNGTVALPLNEWLRFRMRGHVGTTTTDGAGDISVFRADGSVVDTVALVNANLGTTDIVSFTLGKTDPDTHASSWTSDADDINLASGANGYLRPAHPVYSTLGTSTGPVFSTEEYNGGIRYSMYELNRRNWETVNGTLLASMTPGINTHLAQFRSLGLPITLGLGLHYAPNWYTALGGTLHKVNQDGAVDTGQNMVFSAVQRASAENYMGLVDAAITGGLESIDVIRITSADRAEILYPEGGTPQYNWWGFDAAAQNGTDLAPGMLPCPWPGWLPGQALPAGATTVAPWLDWYLDCLVRTCKWQMDTLTALGFKGQFELLCPGSGSRPSQWAALRNGTTLPAGNIAGVGAVWQSLVAAMPYRSRLAYQCSSVASEVTRVDYPQLADYNLPVTGTTMNGYTSARWAIRIAAEYGIDLAGENPGFGLGASTPDYQNTGAGGLMDRSFNFVDQPGMAYDRFYWAHSTRLHDGTVPASAYYGYIARSLATAAVVVAPVDRDTTTTTAVSLTSSATAGQVITAMNGAFTALPEGVAAPVLSGTATGIGSNATTLVQTFTPTAPGRYTYTASVVSSGITSADSTDIYVTPQVGQAVPVLQVDNVGGYVNVGGAPSLKAAITDNNDTTVAESPFAPTGSAHIQIHAGPYQAGTFRISLRGDRVGTGAITRYVRLYRATNLTTPVYTTSFSLPSSAETTVVTPDSGALAALSLADRRELVWDVSDVTV